MSFFDAVLDKMRLNDDYYEEYDEEYDDDEEYEDEGLASSLIGKMFSEKSLEKRRAREDDVQAEKEPARFWSVVNSKKREGCDEIQVVAPESFGEVRTITDYLLENKVVIVNMEGLNVDTAQRIVDFLCGAVYSLDGTFKAVTNSVIVCVPSGNAVFDSIEIHEYDYETDARSYRRAN